MEQLGVKCSDTSKIHMKIANNVDYDQTALLAVWAPLFKTNNVVSWRFIKFSEVNFSNMPLFFVEKMWEAFAVQKLLSFFQQKISVYLVSKS